MKKIAFSDLNGWLKTAVVVSYGVLAFYALVFLVAFIQEIAAL